MAGKGLNFISTVCLIVLNLNECPQLVFVG